MTTILSMISPETLAALTTTARTAQETTRLSRRLNEDEKKRRDKQQADYARLNKDIDEQLALTKRLSEHGRTRRAGSTAATAPAASRNVYDFFQAREAARQAQLATMNG